MAIDFTTLWPYCDIHEVEVDGQKMVRIPRIYVKNVVLESGTYKGRPAYFMSKEKQEGYHVHPAFMNAGKTCSALDLSCYEASKDAKDNTKPASVQTTSYWQQVNRKTAIDACQKRNVDGGTDEQQGWHCWDIYCQHLLARLMLFEYGTTGFAFQEDGTDYVYRGIHQPAGNPQSPTWLPGLGNIGDKMYLYDSSGSAMLINTGLKCPGNGWPTSFAMTKGSNFDLGDVFVADAVTSTETDGSCSDWQRLARNGVTETGYFTGYRGPYTQDPADAHGMFAISQETDGSNSGYGSPSAVWGYYGYYDRGPLRFRLAHFVA
ncbi:MAG: hypothetical protein MR630_11585 [Selenomonas sp.]|uniref:hypothetical protein n=1 Tax=Selenomonas sp. TaxID=2053611 RepID=UPI0025DA2196|nr:hypothetical protein [Selenomonas sp.]MCI6233231.1 hypothetical protein [Selenomonas sp.]